MRRTRLRSHRCLVLTSLFLIACGADGSVPSAEQASVGGFDDEMIMAAPPAEAKAMGMELESRGTSAAIGTGATDGSAQSDSVVRMPAMVIRNGSIVIRVDSLEPAMQAVQQMATRLDGYVGNTMLSADLRQARSATLEVKVPAARFDEALASLSPIGHVESVSSTAQDVGEEFFDLSARQANSQRLEERLINLLATRAGSLEDVLAVERELARVREEIERYTGRLRYLRTRVAISTLTVTVHEPEPLIGGSGGDNVIFGAFKSAWRNFVQFVAGFIAYLGILVPTAVLVVLAVMGWRRLRRPAP